MAGQRAFKLMNDYGLPRSNIYLNFILIDSKEGQEYLRDMEWYCGKMLSQ